jgi:cell shape-determining protein MreC
MEITEIVFNSLWKAMLKSENDLLDKLKTLDESSDDAQAFQATLEELRIKKINLQAIAKENNFSESAFALDSDSGHFS